jgi:ubiquinone/menaquinone biosynthesis C-methylase UbiE
MSISFEFVMPEVRHNRTLIDLPTEFIEYCGGIIPDKITIKIQGKTFCCRVFDKGTESCGFHVSRAIQNEHKTGEHIKAILETIDPVISSKQENIHKDVARWECYDAVNLLKAVGVRDGYHVLDIGCGCGHYTVPCAKSVGHQGVVYALDKERKPLRALENKLRNYSIGNVSVINADASVGIPLPENCIDIALLYDVIHGEMRKNISGSRYPSRFSLYEEAYRVLRSGGVLSVLSFGSELNSVLFQDGTKKKLTHENMSEEISLYGFSFSHKVANGVHFDWYHSRYQMDKGIRFDDLEQGYIFNFLKHQNEQ